MFDVSGIATDDEDEFRPSTHARPPTVIPAVKRKRLAHEPRVVPHASEMDFAGDDLSGDRGTSHSIYHHPTIWDFELTLFHSYAGEYEDGEIPFDRVPHDFASSGELDSPPQVEEPTEAANVGETTNAGPDSVNPGTSTTGSISLG